ncbi:MAG: autotransporter domain-containing protein [Desulfobaccales bacterium]
MKFRRGSLGLRRQLPGIIVLLAVVLIPGVAVALDLTVDTGLGNSPFPVPPAISFTNEIIGDTGVGVLNQTSSTNTVSNDLTLGNTATGNGTYNLGPAGTLTVTDAEIIGLSGTGTFTLTGGTNTVVNFSGLTLGNNSGSSGTYTQSSGSTSVDNLYVGTNSGASGSFTLGGGTLTVLNDEDIGGGATGTFTQNGGTHTVSSEFIMDGNGSYTLNGGSLSATDEFVGNFGSSTFTQTGGTNSVPSALDVGNNGGTGTYTLSGGTLTAGSVVIAGGGSRGTFTQSGGSNAVAGSLILAGGPNSSGTYNLSAGTLTASGEEDIGFEGTGTFTQTGGTNTVTGNLTLGNFGGGSGTYNLSSGSLTVSGNETIGSTGSGTFNQSGGTNSAPGILFLGSSAGASGTYNLSGGTLSGGLEFIGFIGTGTFNQSGGTNSLASNLNIGNSMGGSGTYNLSAGSLAVTGNETIGNGGSGTFNQTGGTNAVTGNLLVGAGAGNGTYALLGGSATVGGNYTQGANGTFAPGISSAANFEKLMVTGTAALNGTVSPVLLGGYIPALNTLFHGVITTTGGVAGTFSTVTNPISPILSWQAIYTPTTFDLLVKGNFANSALDLTHNQANVGAAMNGLAATATGDLANMLNAIAALPSNNAVANAYQQISADKAASLTTLAFAGANLQKRTLSRRITDLRFGSEDAGLAAGGHGSFNFSRGEGLMLAYNSSSLVGLLTSEKKAEPSASENRWGLYLDPAMILGAQKSSVDQSGFGFTIAGFTAGADYRVMDSLVLGLNTGYAHTGASFRGSGGSVQASTWPLTAYAAYLPKPFYAYGSLGYALNLYDLNRNLNFSVVNRTAKSSTTGNQFNAYAETGYDLKARCLVVTPAVSLAYSKLWVGSFTESGADSLNLNVPSQNAQSLQTGLGAKVSAPLQRNSVTVTPQVYAFYQHEYSNGSRTLDARLSQSGSAVPFVTDSFTGQPNRNFAVVGANVTVACKKNLKVQLDYNAEVGRGNSTAHYLSGGLRWEF